MLENGDVWPKFEDGIAAAAAAAAEREAKRIPLLFLPLGAEEGKGTELTEASEGGDDSDGWMDGAHALALSPNNEGGRSFVRSVGLQIPSPFSASEKLPHRRRVAANQSENGFLPSFTLSAARRDAAADRDRGSLL